MSVPVHRLGHMADQSAAEEPRRAVTVHLPVSLVRALDEHIVNREHDGALPEGTDLGLHRDGILSLALRYFIDHWPETGPYAPRRADATGGARRLGPAASTTDRLEETR